MAELAVINGYDIRDRKLADCAVGTQMSNFETNDQVLIEKSDGSFLKLRKDYFTQAIREVIGTYIHSYDKTTSFSNVPVLDSANDLGFTSTANLASVLGVANWQNYIIYGEYSRTVTVSASTIIMLGNQYYGYDAYTFGFTYRGTYHVISTSESSSYPINISYNPSNRTFTCNTGPHMTYLGIRFY